VPLLEQNSSDFVDRGVGTWVAEDYVVVDEETEMRRFESLDGKMSPTGVGQVDRNSPL